MSFILPHGVAFFSCNCCSSILQYSGVSRNSAVYLVCASSAVPCLGVLGWLDACAAGIQNLHDVTACTSELALA